MPAPAKITPAELDRIRALHADGLSLRAIATELGRSWSAVGKHCRAMGLSFDTDRTKAATVKAQADNATKRAALEARLLDEAGLLLDELHKPHLAYNFGGKDNTYAEHLLDEPDVGAKRALIQAAGTAIDKAVKLADVDRDTSGAQAGQSLVGGLFAFLHGTAPETPEQADETPEE